MTTNSQENNRFEHPVLDEIYNAIDTIKEATAKIQNSKRQLREAVTDLPSKIGENEDLQNQIFHQLYWFHEDVPADLLKKAFQIKVACQARKNELARIMKSAFVEFTCIECHHPYPIEVTSRTQLQTLQHRIKLYGFASGWGEPCKECQDKRNLTIQQQKEQQKYHQEQERQRLYQLQTMPYREYLQTPEWATTRANKLRKAGYRCQVCNAHNAQLNVHHRTYERRGCEIDADLIVLCRNCHEIFHTNGKLAQG